MSATTTPPRSPLDSYLEFEVYLTRTQKEIGDAFDELVYGEVAKRIPLAPSNLANTQLPIHQVSPTSTAPSSISGIATTKHVCRHCGAGAASTYSEDAGSERSSSIPSSRTASPVDLRSKWRPRSPPPVPRRAASLWLDPRLARCYKELESRRSLSMPSSYAIAAPPSPPVRNSHRSMVRSAENHVSARNGGCYHQMTFVDAAEPRMRRTSCPSPPPELLKLSGPLPRDEPFVRELLEQTDQRSTRGSRSRRDFWENRNAVTVSIPTGEELLHWCPRCSTLLQQMNPSAALWKHNNRTSSGSYAFKKQLQTPVDTRYCPPTMDSVKQHCRASDSETYPFRHTFANAASGRDAKSHTFPLMEKPHKGRSPIRSVVPESSFEPKPVSNINNFSASSSTFFSPILVEEPVDVNELSAFVDSLVDEVNNFDVDDDLESSEKHYLDKFVACFPKAEKRTFAPLLIKPAMACEKLSPDIPAGEATPLVDDVFEDNPEDLSSCSNDQQPKNGVEAANLCVIPTFPENYSIFDRRRALIQANNKKSTSDQNGITSPVSINGESIHPIIHQPNSCSSLGVPEVHKDEQWIGEVKQNSINVEKQAAKAKDPVTETSSSSIVKCHPIESGSVRIFTDGSLMAINSAKELFCNGKSENKNECEGLASRCDSQADSGDKPLMTSSPISKDDRNCAVYPSSVLAEINVAHQRPKSRNLGEFMRLLETSIRETTGTPTLDGDQDSLSAGEISVSSNSEHAIAHRVADAVTQTSPPTSRACSWLSDCNCPNDTCDHQRLSVVWGASSNSDLLDESINEKLSTLGSTTCSSIDEFGNIISKKYNHEPELTVSESQGSSCDLLVSLDNSTAGPSSEDNDSFSSASSTLGSNDTSPDNEESPESPEFPFRASPSGLDAIWVLRSSFDNAKLPSVSENDDPEVVMHDFERRHQDRFLDSKIAAPSLDKLCRSASTPPHTLSSSTKITGMMDNSPRISLRSRTKMSESQPGGLCHQGGESKFGTVPLSKPKNLVLNISASGVSHSSPGFSLPSADQSSSRTLSDKGNDSIRELPSSPWAQPHILDYNKSSSAPILGERDHRSDGLRKVFQRNGAGDGGAEDSSAESEAAVKNFTAPRSQSAKELSELEAVEACKWLRATGFPQYAQMFEDQQFPIDVSSVHKDHDFLDNDSIQSLFRRLNALNRCARMRLDNLPRKISGDDSDEENQCALSENWEFQRQSRRWSRIPGNFEAALAKHNSGKEEWSESVDEEGAPPSGEDEGHHCSHHRDMPLSGDSVPMDDERLAGTGTLPSSDKTDSGGTGSGLKRSGSERFKDSAKALLRRVESIKSRRSKRKNREAVVISGPLLDVPIEGDLACVQITPPDTPASIQPSSPTGESSSPSPNSPSDASQHNVQGSHQGHQFFGGGGSLHYGRDGEPCALSDSECSPTLWRSSPASPTGRCYMDNYLAPDSPRLLAVNGTDTGDGINYRTGSFNLGVESNAYRERFQENQRTKRGSKRTASGLEHDRHSLYDNVPVVIFNKGYTDENGEPLQEEDIFKNITSLNTAFARPSDQRSNEDALTNEHASSTADSASVGSANLDVSDQDNRSIHQQWERRDSGVGLSLTRSDRSQPKWQTSSYCHRPSIPCRTVPLNELTSGQMMVIRKLALLKLTALMERYSPSNRSGWNWAMPKFIKRMKTPDYKDKTVFGVPLVVVLQRTGNPIPAPIQEAIRFIRKNAIDSVGIFRKSGVRSRIQKLKNSTEANPTGVSYEEQQPYDVADMIKQYFRELPEALLTNKMSETFIGIYQHIEEDVRLEALQAAVVLMPDENREVLQALLTFLNDVSCRAEENQMTASNLAVCFAPSLFHMNSPRSQSTSPRRRKTVGVPDQRELNENRAAHECLTHMIRDFNSLFSIPDDILAQCRCPYMEQWHPPTMDELQQKTENNDWRVAMEIGIQWLLKESREKFKGWVSVSTNDNTELAYKKMGDGNPLRVWKAAVEVEAPPSELLVRVLRERHMWDPSMLKWRVIDKLDKQTEVFQYVCSSMTPLPARDYCVLRSWKTDLPKGTCVLVESSVDHQEASPLLGGVRGIILDSKYLIEPCGSGKSRVTHISRVDARGRSPDWYNKAYGQMCSLYLSRLRDSLQHAAEGPESKV